MSQDRLVRFTNCRLLRNGSLLGQDLLIDASTGRIVDAAGCANAPCETIDLGGRILSPGLIDCQLNGAYGFNFSSVPDDISAYEASIRQLNKQVVATGVTSYLPTLTSQSRTLYHKGLAYLGPSGQARNPHDGSESLGAHVEGPFINTLRNGIHHRSVLRAAATIDDILDCYGRGSLSPEGRAVKMMTVAPEVGAMTSLIPKVRDLGVTVSIGHTEASYDEALAAVAAGASMITHLFNVMRPAHHRDPSVLGLLGLRRPEQRPYFGIIADGVHLHPATVQLALRAHPEGFVLVTDAMHLTGLPDGEYDWVNGDEISRIVKTGTVQKLKGTETISGSCVTLLDCANVLLRATDATVGQALRAATETPAAMLGIGGTKGTLVPGADADLVVLSEETSPESSRLVVDEVWKFGVRVFSRVSEGGPRLG